MSTLLQQGRPGGTNHLQADPALAGLAAFIARESKMDSLDLWREKRFVEYKREYCFGICDALGYEGQEDDADELVFAIRKGGISEAKEALDRIFERAAEQYAHVRVAEEEKEMELNYKDFLCAEYYAAQYEH